MTGAAASGTSGAADATDEDVDGTQEALGSFVGRNQMKFRYLLLAVALAVAWWQTVGALSAWVAGFGFVALTPSVQSLVGVLLSRRWPETEGVVVESSVLTEPEAREYAGFGAAIEETHDTGQFSGGYVPLVRYEFTVDGRRYVTASISPFDDTISKRHGAAALVEQFRENSHVSVRYDPDDPTRAYLRPWTRSTMGVLPVIGLAFVAAAAWFAAGMPGGPAVVPLAIGIPVAALGFSRLVTGLRSRRWPTTTGTVTATGVDSRSSTEGGGSSYKPGLQYEYTVDGTSYVSTRYALGDSEPSFDSREAAESWLAENYPVDAEVTVHYDPDRPGSALLEPGSGGSVSTLLFGLVFTGLGVVMLLFPEATAV